MRCVALAVVALAFASAVAVASPQQPANPVIGIISHPVDQCRTPPTEGGPYDQCVESYYPRWLEDSGIRVVAIPWNATAETQQWFLDRVNGVLFQGGDIGSVPGRFAIYVDMVTRILKYALARNAAGDKFVVWGTCQGFQVLAAAAAGNNSVVQGNYPNMYPAMLPINFTLAQPTSRLFSDAWCPAHVRRALLTRNSTLNWHHDIVTPTSWANFPSLSATFTMLSTNIVPGSGPNTGVEFVSAYEAPNAEVYATQFHPERPPYEFSNDIIGHDEDTLAVSQYLANFIASRLKLNNHSFDSAQQWEDNRLSRWPLVDDGWGTRTYYIKVGDPVQ